MDFWIHFWTIVLILSLALFAGLAVVVSIGAFFDVWALFKSIEAQHDKENHVANEVDP